MIPRKRQRRTDRTDGVNRRCNETEQMHRFRKVFPEDRPHFKGANGEHFSVDQVVAMSHREYQNKVLGHG